MFVISELYGKKNVLNEHLYYLYTLILSDPHPGQMKIKYQDSPISEACKK